MKNYIEAGEVYSTGRYVVTGIDGFYRFSTRVTRAYGFVTIRKPLATWRVVNMETRKIASPEFGTAEEAMFHADLLVTAHSLGIVI